MTDEKKPGAGERTSVSAMRDIAQITYKPALAAGKAYADAYKALMASSDVVEVMKAMVTLAVAAEHLKDMATEAEKCIRSTLSDEMDATGATTVKTDAMTAYLTKVPEYVSVDQPDLVPSSYMVKRDDVLDTKRIKEDIEAGNLVPGCRIVRPNGYRLAMRARKGKS